MLTTHTTEIFRNKYVFLNICVLPHFGESEGGGERHPIEHSKQLFSPSDALFVTGRK